MAVFGRVESVAVSISAGRQGRSRGTDADRNVSYIRGLPAGTTVHIDCEVIQAGRVMGMIRGVIRSTDGKYIYSTCEHHKVNHGPSEEMLEYEVKPKL